MAKHEVTITLPERELGKADAEFTIKKDRKMLGKLKVSRGSIEWVPKDNSYGHKLSWTDFAALMCEKGIK